MCEQNEKFNQMIENIRRYQIEVTELKKTLTKNYIRGVQQQTRRSKGSVNVKSGLKNSPNQSRKES